MDRTIILTSGFVKVLRASRKAETVYRVRRGQKKQGSARVNSSPARGRGKIRWLGWRKMGLREFCRNFLDEQAHPQQVEGAELPLSTHTPPEATIKCRPLRTASRKQFDLLSKSWRPIENRFIVETDRSGRWEPEAPPSAVHDCHLLRAAI